MNGYLLWRARAALSLGAKGTMLLGGWLLLMILAPVLMRMCERANLVGIARVMAWIGWCWLGFLFLFICASVAFDLLRGTGTLAGLAFGEQVARFAPSVRLSFFVALTISLLGNVYGFFEAREIRTEHIVIRSAKVPREVGRFRIVQISDVHFGLILRRGLMGRMASAVQASLPDLLVSTGDLVDGDVSELDGLSDRLAALPARVGKFAVTGNHEFYAGIEKSLEFTRKAGFTVLRQEQARVGNWLTVVGVDDPAGSHLNNGQGAPDERPILAAADPSNFIILLKHQPVIKEGAAGRFDLQLSGHVHGGQIFPFNFVARLSYPFWRGLATIPEGGEIYVSRGTGTWGPPVRFGAPPEITVIDLESLE
jgi:predicted MPP superfamily phosphohydrolase